MWLQSCGSALKSRISHRVVSEDCKPVQVSRQDAKQTNSATLLGLKVLIAHSSCLMINLSAISEVASQSASSLIRLFIGFWLHLPRKRRSLWLPANIEFHFGLFTARDRWKCPKTQLAMPFNRFETLLDRFSLRQVNYVQIEFRNCSGIPSILIVLCRRSTCSLSRQNNFT